jgi:AraC-like DNA-binding protein
MRPIFEKINHPKDQSFYLEEVAKPYFIDQWHSHPEIEILYISQGNGIKYVGDSINSFFPGEIVIIGSDTPHVWSSNSEYLNSDSKLNSKAICIQFKENFFGKSLLEIPEAYKILELFARAYRGIQFINSTQDVLIEQITALPCRIGMDKLIGLLKILDIMSISEDFKYLSSPYYSSRKINSEDKDRMETIFRFVIQNYSKKIMIEEISSMVHLTPPSFCRYFKSRTTKVFSYFVNEVRIGNACKMLIENKYNISQICFESGFYHLSNFNRQFKKIKGITPSEFQLKYKNRNFDQLYDK